MKNKYVEKREKLSAEITNLVNIIYKDDHEMLGLTANLLNDLTIADPNDEFVDGMLGFMMWASDRPKVEAGSVLSTLLHDLSEFSRNRTEKWFCPRTSGYQKYLSGASNVRV